MSYADNLAWLRRDGAPLAVSLALHLGLLLLIMPWLVMRSIPAPPVEVEVTIEMVGPEPQRDPQPVRAQARAVQQAPAQTRAVVERTQPVEPPDDPPRAVSQPEVPPQVRPAPETESGQGMAGRAALASREAAGLSAPKTESAPNAVAPRPLGSSAWLGSLAPGALVPLPASAGNAAQSASRSPASTAVPGESTDNGPLALTGSVPQALAAQPEFRHAARPGGQLALAGGSRAPGDGLARDTGSPDQLALQATRSLPQAVAGAAAGRQGQPSTLTPPPPVTGAGQGRVAAVERPGTGQPRLAAAAGDTGPMGLTPTAAPSGSGRGSETAGRARATGPAERGSGLVQTAAPESSAQGAALAGGGSGAGVSGEGRAPRGEGRATSMRESSAPFLEQAMEAGPARLGANTNLAHLSEGSPSNGVQQPVREVQAAALQPQRANGEAKLIEERFNAPALKVDSPRSICELPLMFAGFDRRPIPSGLDSINATAATLPDELPPRHHPGNQLPRYPFQAVGSRAEGRAVVRAEVLSDGRVGKTWIKHTSGAAVLDTAALETVRGWRFHPGQRHGMAVAMWLDVPIEYKLP